MEARDTVKYPAMHETVPNQTDSRIWPKLSMVPLLRSSDDCCSLLQSGSWPPGTESHFCDGLEGHRSPGTCHRLRMHLEEGWISPDPKTTRCLHGSSFHPEPGRAREPGCITYPPYLPMGPPAQLPPLCRLHAPATQACVMWGAGVWSLEQARPSWWW